MQLWGDYINKKKGSNGVDTYLSKEMMLEASNEEEAVAYVGLKIMLDKMLSQNRVQVEANCNIANLFYELSGSLKPNKRDREKLIKGIQGLIDAGVINLIDHDKDNYVLDIAGLKIDSSHDAYTHMTREEIRTIFNLPCKQKFNLLRFAVGIFGTIHSDYKCGFASFKKMPGFTGVTSVTSCQEHFNRLEEAGVIYVCHSNQAKRDRDGTIKNLSNCYGRPCDKQAIDKYYVDRCIKQGHDFTNTMSPARKAKLTRNYNKYINDAYDGDITELIMECLTFNKISYNEEHPEYQKDISVFDPDLVKIAEVGLQEHIKQGKKLEKQQEKEKTQKESVWAAVFNPEAMKQIANQAKAWKERENYSDDECDYFGSYDENEDDWF